MHKASEHTGVPPVLLMNRRISRDTGMGKIARIETYKKPGQPSYFMERFNIRLRSNENGFKSKGEIQISRFLDRSGIAYLYEYPFAVVDQGKVRIWYPDFQLPEYGIILEYFGVNGKKSYDEQARHKIEVYGKMGLDGIFLTNASFKGDWPGRILGQIEGILKNRMDRFNNRDGSRI